MFENNSCVGDCNPRRYHHRLISMFDSNLNAWLRRTRKRIIDYSSLSFRIVVGNFLDGYLMYELVTLSHSLERDATDRDEANDTQQQYKTICIKGILSRQQIYDR